MPRLNLAAALAALTLVLAACNTVNRPAAPDLDRSAWTLAELDGAATAPDAVTLRFEGGRASGSDGCNRFGSPYESGSGRLAFGAPRVGTQKACPEPATKLAAAFQRALDATRGYRIDAGRLLLLGADGRTLARLDPQATALAGTAWQVTAYNNGRQAVTGVLGGSTLTIVFGGDGTLSGSAGCNSYSAPYRGDGSTLSIGPARTTRMACAAPEGVMAQEAAFLAALTTVAHAQREADRLELRTAGGALAVSAGLAPQLAAQPAR
jgi:heat shock protein HslJ